MSKVDEDVRRISAPIGQPVGQSLLVIAAGGVVTSGLIAMLASAEAYAARVLTSANQSSELYALRNLAMLASETGTRPRTATRDVSNDRMVVNTSLAAGAPVVT